ncbi:nitroreductase family protein [Candidatus Mycoplasma mahonii]|uniref:nitroreductase family protein n=1 Tax=Candidatus Mycoplasma mahonii TaxID=3004105 RepID=UPI0026F05F03|nr:nitroreductase family protein [Candidatus Mycoplasma mahonii]WKX02228.1 nitroreductase family protein [Candidatus Mycoplasma mahonii]
MSIENFIERVSVRDFDKKPMSKKDIKIITEVINNSPTSMNIQQFSAIIITDQKIKKWIGEMNYNQQHIIDSAAFILFVTDRTRIRHIIKNQKLNQDIAFAELRRTVVDTTIAATYAHDAFIEMGYGVTFVGGVVGFAEQLEKKLDLPKTTSVIVGLSVGKATKHNALKPKMNKVFINKYNKTDTLKEVIKYDKEHSEYLRKIQNGNNYGELIKSLYSVNRYAKGLEGMGQYVNKKIKEFK